MIYRDGIVVKSISGFFYVNDGEHVRECKAKGNFKLISQDILVGDRVSFCIHNSGYPTIEKVYSRNSLLLRPPVANIDHMMIVFALINPEPDLFLLDKLTVMGEMEGLDVTIVFTKQDIGDIDTVDSLRDKYSRTGYELIFTDKNSGMGLEAVKSILKGKLSVLAGPSGVGKSSLINTLQSEFRLETGEISSKNKRGKHTTRHVQLLSLNGGGFVLDTPGFSSLDMIGVEADALRMCFKEIASFEGKCRFNGCRHNKEPDCAVKIAVDENLVSKSRYNNYITFLEEVCNRRKKYV